MKKPTRPKTQHKTNGWLEWAHSVKGDPMNVESRASWPGVGKSRAMDFFLGEGPLGDAGIFTLWLAGRRWRAWSDGGDTHALLANIEAGNHVDDYFSYAGRPQFPPKTCLVNLVTEEQIDRFGAGDAWMLLVKFLLESGAATEWNCEGGERVTIEEVAQYSYFDREQELAEMVAQARAERERIALQDSTPLSSTNQHQSRAQRL